MKPDLEEKLFAKYPAIFEGRTLGPKESLMCFGLAVGDGWYNIIDALCESLYRPVRIAEAEYRHMRWRELNVGKGDLVTAVDVERARLAALAAQGEVPRAVQVKEKFGSLHFYLTRTPTSEQQVAVEFAEAMSRCTCEICGSPGEILRDRWHKALCEKHSAQRKI
jgi:hypothetical protein